MINSRLALHEILTDILGSNNVYFQKPEHTLKYPCIVYSLKDVPEKFADNTKYDRNYNYTITLIDPDPDNGTVDKLLALDHSKFEKWFATQGLNHYVINLYYKNEKGDN